MWTIKCLLFYLYNDNNLSKEPWILNIEFIPLTASQTMFNNLRRSKGSASQTISFLRVKLPQSAPSSLLPNYFKILNLKIIFEVLSFKLTWDSNTASKR